MKTIGLIGGMSWESTVTYYQLINRLIKEKLGGFHSAKCLLASVDFAEIERCQMSGDWQKSAEILANCAKNLQNGGADFIVLCTNTMHKVADHIQSAVKIPLLHIAHATADRLLQNGITKTLLLGTKFTMEEDFYKQVLKDRGITVIIPNAAGRQMVNNVIYNELCMGKISQDSKHEFLRIIEQAAKDGAKGVILGCTEIGLLVTQNDTATKVFDTTKIHAEQAVLKALE